MLGYEEPVTSVGAVVIEKGKTEDVGTRLESGVTSMLLALPTTWYVLSSMFFRQRRTFWRAVPQLHDVQCLLVRAQ